MNKKTKDHYKGVERRQHPRKKKRVKLNCYLNGQRFDANSVNISAGGALIKTEDDIEPGSLLLVTTTTSAGKRGPVVLVGHTVRKQAKPLPGIGVKWLRAVSGAGLDAMFDFLALFLELYPAALPLPPPQLKEEEFVGFDFIKRRFYKAQRPEKAGGPANLKKILEEKKAKIQAPTVSHVPPSFETQTRTPKAGPQEPVPDIVAEGAQFSRSTAPGVVTTYLDQQGISIPVKIPVRAKVGNRDCTGIVRAIGLSTLFVELSDLSFDIQAKWLVQLPIKTKQRKLLIHIYCSCISVDVQGVSGYKGVALHIIEKKEGAQTGIFERYVKFLYSKYVTQARPPSA